MKIHKIIIPPQDIERCPVGNAMKLEMEYEHGKQKLHVYGAQRSTTIKALPGDMIAIQSGGLEPPIVKVMAPPENPVKRVFWEHGFYKTNKAERLENLKGRVRNDESTYGYINDEGTVAVAYRKVMFNQRGVPFGWWYDHKKATVADVKKLIGFVLSQSLGYKANLV